MKKKLLILGITMSGLTSAQADLQTYKIYPYIDEISAVQEKNGVKFVVTLEDYEYYNSSRLNCIGEYNPLAIRDTIIVNSKYPVCHLIDETEWENGDAFTN